VFVTNGRINAKVVSELFSNFPYSLTFKSVYLLTFSSVIGLRSHPALHCSKTRHLTNGVSHLRSWFTVNRSPGLILGKRLPVKILVQRSIIRDSTISSACSVHPVCYQTGFWFAKSCFRESALQMLPSLQWNQSTCLPQNSEVAIQKPLVSGIVNRKTCKASH
jgi:hypothetical protein